MKRRATFITATLILLCLAGMGLLAFIAQTSTPFSNRFTRNVRPYFLLNRVDYAVSEADYIAGSDDEVVYLAVAGDGMKISALHLTTGEIAFQEFGSADVANGAGDVRISIRGSKVLIYDNSLGKICVGSIPFNWNDCFTDHHFYLQQAVPLPGSNIVFQGVVEDTSSGENLNIVGSFHLADGEIKYAPEILRGDKDRYYTTRGILRDGGRGRMVYTYLYSGRFVVFDTTLEKKYEWATIDGNLTSAIKPVKLSEDSYSLASPDWRVNENARVYENYLLIQSNVLSAGELPDTTDSAAVIDVYKIEDGSYQYSFYVPGSGGEVLKDFEVAGRKFVAQFKKRLLVYDIEL